MSQLQQMLPAGIDLSNIYQLVNHTEPVFDFEEKFVPDAFMQWLSDNLWQCYLYSIIYCLFIWWAQKYMSERKSFELRLPLVIWSVSLAIFSILASIRTFPEMLEALTVHGLRYSVCEPSYFDTKVVGFWSMMFVLSKPVELGDTFFIVMRKRNLIFLHWYHHISVMIYVWHSYLEHNAAGRWFFMMNFIVHSVMYSFYALRAMKFTLPKSVSMFVTSLQITQMIVGIWVVFYAGYVRIYLKQGCNISKELIFFGIIMYLSYFYLFVKFFIDAYLGKKPPAPAAINNNIKKTE